LFPPILTNPMCLFFWSLIAALFVRIFVVQLHVWQTASAKRATAQQKSLRRAQRWGSRKTGTSGWL